MKKQYQLPAPYSNQWLKELKAALEVPSFKTKPSTQELLTKSHYTKQGKEKTNCYGRKEYTSLGLTDQDWSNLQIARTLIENRLLPD